MRKSFAISAWLFIAGFICLLFGGQSPLPGFPPGVFLDRGAIDAAPAAGGCSQATATIARLDGTQNAGHNTAYTTFICDLVIQSVWAKLDLVYLFATNDTANALTNLVSSSFAGVAHGSPTFGVDAGYTGVDSSTTIYIDTQFNPTTAGGNYTQNAAHISMWSNTNAQSTATGGIAIGLQGTSGSQSNIFPKYSDGKEYFRVNDVLATPAAGITNATSTGQFLANRSAASTQQGYRNAVSQGVVSVTSGAMVNHSFVVLANITTIGTVSFGDAHQSMAITIGGSLSSGDVTNLCHETNLYLSAIAGVAGGVC